jgi:hypothetical protein
MSLGAPKQPARVLVRFIVIIRNAFCMQFAMVNASPNGLKSPLHLMIVLTEQVNFSDFYISLLGDTHFHLLQTCVPSIMQCRKLAFCGKTLHQETPWRCGCSLWVKQQWKKTLLLIPKTYLTSEQPPFCSFLFCLAWLYNGNFYWVAQAVGATQQLEPLMELM